MITDEFPIHKTHLLDGPIALAARLPGAPGPRIKSKKTTVSEVVIEEPTIRKSFPESWIFENFEM